MAQPGRLSREFQDLREAIPFAIGTDKALELYTELESLQVEVIWETESSVEDNRIWAEELLDSLVRWTAFLGCVENHGTKKAPQDWIWSVCTHLDSKPQHLMQISDGVELFVIEIGAHRSYHLVNTNEAYHYVDYSWMIGRFDGFGLTYLEPGMFTPVFSRSGLRGEHFHFHTNATGQVE
jgi:hypothetical protein